MSSFSRWKMFWFWLSSFFRNSFYHLWNHRPLLPCASLDEIILAGNSPLNLAKLLIGRKMVNRSNILGYYFSRKQIKHQGDRFTSAGRSGINYIADVGDGPKTLILIAHHDAVPGSPGANDNASSVGILLSLIDQVEVPQGVRVRFLFPDQEENGMIGSREYVKMYPPTEDVVGVLSLELCGIGNAVVLVDVQKPTTFLTRVVAGLDKDGLILDKTYFIVDSMSFQSDHLSFCGHDIPSYCFSIMPREGADELRGYVQHPWKGRMKMLLSGIPKPFDTYHRSTDSIESLEESALELAVTSLQSIITSLDS